MARRPTKRQNLQLESLESRQMLSVAGATVGDVAPTATKQYMLELTNLVRTNPQAAADRLTSNFSPSTVATLKYYGVNLDQAKQLLASVKSRQPLAWNSHLAQAAQGHSNDMATVGYQSHTGSDGSSPDQRMAQAGYSNARKTVENAFAYAESVDQAMQAFTLDWGVPEHSHLRNMTEPDTPDDQTMKEVGIGITDSTKPGFAKVVTQDFGLRNNSSTYLLGVAYSDNNHDNFYTPGEGQGGVEIDLTNDQGQTFRTLSGAAGGYQIPLAPGHYHLTALLGGQQIRSQDINIANQNVKVDFDLTDPVTPSSSQDSSRSQSSQPQAQSQNQVQTPSAPQAAVQTNSSDQGSGGSDNQGSQLTRTQPQAQQINPPTQTQTSGGSDSGSETKGQQSDATALATDTPPTDTTTTPTKQQMDAIDAAMILGSGLEIDDWQTWDFVPVA